MEIGIIGAGKVARALAFGWSKAGHKVVFGVRDIGKTKMRNAMPGLGHIPVMSIAKAVARSDVLVLAVPAHALSDLPEPLKTVGDKIIIDPANSFPVPPIGYENCFEAIVRQSDCAHVVKAFNNTGFQNLAEPGGFDTFVAGDSEAAKIVARQLSVDLGFARCYDFGDRHKAGLLEQLAVCWINLAYFQELGTGFGLNVVYRPN